MHKKVVIVSLVIMLGLIFSGISYNVQAAEMTLDKDTALHPQGWLSSDLKFQKGPVVLNERGEVVSGIMKERTYLRPAGDVHIFLIDQYVYVKCDTLLFAPGLVVFNERGEVISGVLDHDQDVSLYNDLLYYVGFRKGKELTFSSDHSVSKGTLNSNQSLRPLGWNNQTWPTLTQSGFILFKGDTQVVFSKGEVVSGTLAQDTELMTTYGKKKLFLADTFVTFNEKGEAS